MHPVLLQSEPIPVAEMGATVLLVSVLVTAIWLLYLYR